MSEENIYITTYYDSINTAKDVEDEGLKSIELAKVNTRDVSLYNLHSGSITHCTRFDNIVNINWFGSYFDIEDIIDLISHTNPKYLMIEHYVDSGKVNKYGFFNKKKSTYNKVLKQLSLINDSIGFLLAFEKRNRKEVEKYLENGLIPIMKYKGNEILGFDDLYWSHTPLTISLINSGANIEAITQSGRYDHEFKPIHHAARNKNTSVIKVLIEKNVNINEQVSRKYNYTPLHMCVGFSDKAYKGCKLLLTAGANPNMIDDKGHTPLLQLIVESDELIKENLLKYIKLFEKYNYNFNYVFPKYGSILNLIIKLGESKSINYLKKKNYLLQEGQE